jgi:hypothetical protein
MKLRDKIYLHELLEQFRQQIIDEWPTKWTAHGAELINFSAIRNKNAFLEDLLVDIEETMKAEFGLDRAADLLISKDLLRRRLFEQLPGQDFNLQDKTRLVFCRYLGYADWDAFKARNQSDVEQQPLSITIVQVYQSVLPALRRNQFRLQTPTDWAGATLPPRPHWINWRLWLLSLLVLAGLGFGGMKAWDWYKNRPFTAAQLAGVKFRIMAKYGRGLPQQINVVYDIRSLGDTTGASISFDRQEDYITENRLDGMLQKSLVDGEVRNKLKTPVGTTTHVYYLPAPYVLKLRVRGQVIRQIQNIVYSDNQWIGYATSQTNHWASYAYPEKWLIKDGTLALPRSLIEDPLEREDYMPRLVLCKDFGIDGDEVDLSVRVKNPMDLTGMRCLGGVIQCSDETGHGISIPFGQKSCSQWMSLRVAQTTYADFVSADYAEPGQNEVIVRDLSSVLPDETENFHVFRVRLAQGTARFLLDGQERLQFRYKGNLTTIQHLLIASKGTGYVDWVKIVNSRTGRVAFFDDFCRTGAAQTNPNR